MTDAVRSAAASNAALLHMDQQVMAYLGGRGTLEATVALCVATLGTRPTLTVSLANADEAVRERLGALQAALAEIRARTG